MLPEELQSDPRVSELSHFDPEAIVTGKSDRGELTLEIPAGRIVPEHRARLGLHGCRPSDIGHGTGI